ncbi:MAG: glycosyltransferase family 4 protein [Beijerinckiaceae bacterium]|nr:glycosyltransferase family 4 protein [Beijerinckiaceae bacterium]NBX61714.1 glycosyltransferase family 1 protein [Betaproteobacteria bacterium]
MALPKLLFLVTDDRYFISHRLPMARAAKSAGFEVHVGTRVKSFGAAIRSEGYIVHDLPWEKLKRTPFDIIKDIWAIRLLYQSLKPDIVHHIALVPVMFGQIAATGLGIATVNTIAGLGSGFIGRGFKGKLLKSGLVIALRTLLSRRSSITVVQNADDRAALQSIGVPSDSIRLVAGSGVDTDLLKPLPEPEGPITIGIAARMLEDKGIRPLVEAQALLRKKGLNTQLLLAGDYDPTNRSAIKIEELQAFARQPGVEWLGHIEDIAALWARCHIAALPSRREGLPKALLEAASLGRPLVATDVPGCRDVAVDGETGLLVPVDDAKALASAIETLVRDPALRAKLGANGRRRVEKLFSSTAIGTEIAAIYRDMAELRIADPQFAV